MKMQRYMLPPGIDFTLFFSSAYYASHYNAHHTLILRQKKLSKQIEIDPLSFQANIHLEDASRHFRQSVIKQKMLLRYQAVIYARRSILFDSNHIPFCRVLLKQLPICCSSDKNRIYDAINCSM